MPAASGARRGVGYHPLCPILGWRSRSWRGKPGKVPWRCWRRGPRRSLCWRARAGLRWLRLLPAAWQRGGGGGGREAGAVLHRPWIPHSPASHRCLGE
eukprot:3214338-Heterocapsa_arctica.AAC.1